MTSISSSGYPSPLQQLQAELQSEVNSGDVNSSDQSALSSALTDINGQLQTGAPAEATSTTNSSPGDIKSKIDGLIAGEVSSGKLTTNQATELQGVFQAAFSSGSDDAGSASVASAPSNAGAPPAGGPPPGGPPPGGPGGARGHHGGGHGSAASSPTSSAASSSSSSTSNGASANEVLQQFLTSLKATLTASSPTVYGATGTTSTPSDLGSTTSSLLIDYKT